MSSLDASVRAFEHLELAAWFGRRGDDARARVHSQLSAEYLSQAAQLQAHQVASNQAPSRIQDKGNQMKGGV